MIGGTNMVRNRIVVRNIMEIVCLWRRRNPVVSMMDIFASVVAIEREMIAFSFLCFGIYIVICIFDF